MPDRTRSAPPAPLPPETLPDVRETHEIVRFIFSAMIDAGISESEFARRIEVSETTLENWRNPKKYQGDPRGPTLVHVIRALHALGLRLDIRSDSERQGRLPLATRTGLAELERDRRRRGETFDEADERRMRAAEDARRKGQLRDV